MANHPAGTIFVLRSKGFVGWSIRLLTRSGVNHAGVCNGEGDTVEAQAAGAVVKVEPGRGKDVTYGDALLARIAQEDPHRGTAIAQAAELLVGTPYNFLDLVALAWACRHDPTGVPERPNWWQRRVMRSDRLICSQLVDKACLMEGVHLFDDGRLPGQVTPGALETVLADDDWPIVIDPLGG